METHKFGPFTINYVPREEWDTVGRKAGYYTGPENFTALVPHHTVTGFVLAYYELVIDRMRFLQNLRPDLGGDIPYNWVVFAGQDDNEAWVAEGRGLGWTGAHTYGYNSSVHAASFWGNSVTDPVSPAVLEAFRFCGRLMPYATNPTLDHGQYPNQGTACAGTKIRAALDQLQPPFNTPGNLINIPPNENVRESEVYDFKLRTVYDEQGKEVIDVFNFREGLLQFDFPVVAYDCGVVDKGDEITVSVHGPNRDPVTVGIIEPNGNMKVSLAQWGLPASFVVDGGSGWTAVLLASTRWHDVKVMGRG